MWVAGALRGAPASTTRTLRRARDEDQGCGQAGGASADDHDVVLTHAPRLEPRGRFRLRTLLFVGNGSQMSLVEDTSAAAIAAVLDQVGARLKRHPHPTRA